MPARKRRQRVDVRNLHGLCHRLGRGYDGLSTAFLGAAETAFGALLGRLWIGRPRGPASSTDLGDADLSAVAGLSVDLAAVRGNVTTDRAGTSRVSVL